MNIPTFGCEGCQKRKEKIKHMANQVSNGNSFGILSGTPGMAGMITLAAIALLVAMRFGFRGVVIKMGK